MTLARRLMERGITLAPLDILTILYTASSLVVIGTQALGTHHLRVSPTELNGLVAAHGLLIVLVVLAAVARSHADSESPSLLAEWYPIVVLAAIYVSVGLVNGPRAAAGISYDSVVQRWEFATFGQQLAHDWSRSRTQAAFAWPLSLTYLGFFPLVIIAPAALWLRGHVTRARQTIFGISLAFFACYIVFLVFPVAGPNYLWGWPSEGVHTGLPTRFVRTLIEGGDSWGSAFPSSHVAASMAATLLALRNWRLLGWILLPFALGIIVGVVYFQIHYAVDAVAGLVIAVLATMVACRVLPTPIETT
jgi:membrane-associated phospholipid phosphatase